MILYPIYHSTFNIKFRHKSILISGVGISRYIALYLHTYLLVFFQYQKSSQKYLTHIKIIYSSRFLASVVLISLRKDSDHRRFYWLKRFTIVQFTYCIIKCDQWLIKKMSDDIIWISSRNLDHLLGQNNYLFYISDISKKK